MLSNNKIITDVVAMQPRTAPTFIPDKGVADLNSTWESEGVGVLHIRSVYDFGDETFNGCFLNECSAASVNSLDALVRCLEYVRLNEARVILDQFVVHGVGAMGQHAVHEGVAEVLDILQGLGNVECHIFVPADAEPVEYLSAVELLGNLDDRL